MKCPACGFETPDSQNWCDFCKEPFKKLPPEEPPVKKSPEPAQLTDDALKRALTSEKALDLLKLTAENERIPVVPQNIRILAWAFFALCILGFVVMAVVLARKAQRHDKAESGEHRQFIEGPASAPPPEPAGPEN
jgi:hypothetical protein